MKDIKINWQTVEDLKKLLQKEDTKNLSLSELVEHIENKNTAKKLEEEAHIERVKNSYKDVYYALYENKKSVLGEALKIYHLKEITNIVWCEGGAPDFKHYPKYQFNCVRILFNKTRFDRSNIDSEFSEDELKNVLVKITKEDFNDYVKMYKRISNNIEEVIKPYRK